MLVQGNQQAIRIGNFIGILEGEGSFVKKGNFKEVNISNLDINIIENCEQYLKENLIYFIRDTYYRKGRPEYVLRIQDNYRQIFQYATILYKLISPSMDCRLNEYQQILGASTTTRAPTIDFDWLGGIFEAEGSFSLTLDYRRNAALAISMSNTNMKIIDKVVINLNKLYCSYHIRDKKVTGNHKPAKIIAICGMLRCQTFLNKMIDKWHSKRHIRMTDLILEFSNSRLSHSRKDPYSSRELQIIQSVIDLNG